MKVHSQKSIRRVSSGVGEAFEENFFKFACLSYNNQVINVKKYEGVLFLVYEEAGVRDRRCVINLLKPGC